MYDTTDGLKAGILKDVDTTASDSTMDRILDQLKDWMIYQRSLMRYEYNMFVSPA